MANAPSRRSTRFSMRSKQLGQLLLEHGHVDAEHIAKALQIQEKQGGLIGQILRNLKACNDQAIAMALLKQVQVTDIHCEEIMIDEAVISLITPERCLTDKLCPFERLGNLLCVVMGNPLNRRAINALEEASKLKVKPFKAPWPKIKKLVARSFGEDVFADFPSSPSSPAIDDDPPSVAELMGEASESLDLGMEALETPAPVHEPEPLPEPSATIKGLDDLDEKNAEVIESDQRGLTRRMKPVQPDEDESEAASLGARESKKAKVNIDLDALDLDEATEVVGEEEDDADDSLEEIDFDDQGEPGLAALSNGFNGAASKTFSGAGLVEFKRIEAGYFYRDGAAPDSEDDRPAELVELIRTIPVAEVLAASVDAYRAATTAARQEAEIPVESLPSPQEAMLAVSLSDNEFQRMTASMDVDPVGEWAWKYVATGPIPVAAYENGLG